MASREFSVASEPRIPWHASSRSAQPGGGSEQHNSSSTGLSGVVRLVGATGEKLYGRSEELGLLQALMKRVVAQEQWQDRTGTSSSKRREIALVSGESGAGKSTLVRTFRDEVRQNNGKIAFFVEGKFDQNQEAGRPYSAIVDAVTQLYLGFEAGFRLNHSASLLPLLFFPFRVPLLFCLFCLLFLFLRRLCRFLLRRNGRFGAGVNRLSAEFIRLLCSGSIVSPCFFFLLLAVSLLMTVFRSLSTEW
jgi:hypothetical protein